jgi:hypothetical protein
MKRRVEFIRSDASKPYICLELAAYVPGLKYDIEFIRALEGFITSPEYSAFRVDELHPDRSRSRYGGGLVRGYELPFTAEHVLGIEGAWFRDEDPEAHSLVWQSLLKEALDGGFTSLCVNPMTTTHAPRMPEADSPWHDYGVIRDTHTLMTPGKNERWSAFFEANAATPAFVDCLRVVPTRAIDLNGLQYDGQSDLFRGEGRINSGPYVGCRSLEEVIHAAFKAGFSARGGGTFAGSIPAQMGQQGYIPSPTVSLTASAEVAAYYATAGGKRERAAVFALDHGRMKQAGPIWDSFASMTRSATSAWLESDFEIVVKLISGLASLQRAGAVLEGVSEGLKDFATKNYETLSLTSRDYRRFVDPTTWATALTVLSEDELLQLCSVLETFLSWHVIPEGVVSSSRYVAAFLLMRDDLVKALGDAKDEWRHPGWDTTVFGYFAKTCRDKEFFSSGPIAGGCIREAWIVDTQGHRLESLRP